MKRTIKQILFDVAFSVGRTMVLSHDRPYVLPAEKSFPLDAANLRRDADMIALGLNRQFKK